MHFLFCVIFWLLYWKPTTYRKGMDSISDMIKRFTFNKWWSFIFKCCHQQFGWVSLIAPFYFSSLGSVHYAKENQTTDADLSRIHKHMVQCKCNRGALLHLSFIAIVKLQWFWLAAGVEILTSRLDGFCLKLTQLTCFAIFDDVDCSDQPMPSNAFLKYFSRGIQ